MLNLDTCRAECTKGWRASYLGGPSSPAPAFVIIIALVPALCGAQDALPEKATLKHESYEAVFTKASHYELAEIRIEGRTPLRMRTRSQPRSIPPQDFNAPVSVSILNHTAEQFHVAYEQGSFRYESTFAWEGGALSVRRRITCLRSEELQLSWPFLYVTFDGSTERVVYEHGQKTLETALPAKGWTPFFGNWVATVAPDGSGVGIVFPRRTRFAYALSPFGARGAFQVSDLGYWGKNTVQPGMQSAHEVWLVPLRSGRLARQAEAATRTICARLKERRDPALPFFRYSHISPGARGQTLARNGPLTLWQASVSETVLEHAAPPPPRAPGITLALARRETEPIHLVLTAADAMKGVSVTCSSLTSEAGTIGTDRFRVRYSAYARIRPTTEEERAKAEHPKQLRYAAVIDDGKRYLQSDTFYGSASKSIGAVEDVLFDRDSVGLKPGRNQPVWITLSVPRDAQPGLYRGEIRVAAGDQLLVSVPIEVTVWSFTLPRISSMNSWYQVFPHFLFPDGPDKYPRLRAHSRDYYRDLAEHKVSGFGHIPVPPKVRLTDGKVVVDWREFDDFAAYVFDELGMRNAKLPWGKRGEGESAYEFLGLKENTPEFDAALTAYLGELREHLQRRGWLERMDCYLWDEPQPAAIEAVRRVALIMRKSLPGVDVFVAGGRNSIGLEGVVTAWCPGVNEWKLPAGPFHAKRIAEGRERGEVFWWYNLAYDALGDPVVTHRALPWVTWRENVDGYFIWAINTWGSPERPWVQGNPIGSGFYIYPGLNGPVDSIRWEQTRDGLEDYDYIVMLEKAPQKNHLAPELISRGQAALSRARRLTRGLDCLIGVDPHELRQIRQEIGEILDRLARASRPDTQLRQ